MKYSPGISNFFLKRSLVLPILLFSSMSLYWSLRKAFLYPLAIPWNSAFRWIYLPFSPLPSASVLFSAICNGLLRQSFCLFCVYFPWGWSWSSSHVQCHEPLSIVLQALCISDLIPWIYLSLPLYNPKGSGKEYVKAVYCQPAYLTYMQSTSWEMLDWVKHKLESREKYQ